MGTDVLRDAGGDDISPPTHWRSTMMANAARDPYWRAQVASEVAEFPELQSVIEDKCTTCHAPMGRYEAVLGGAEAFSMAEAMADPMSLDGVSCTVCHQIRDDGLGEDGRFSGTFSVGTGDLVYGPYEQTSPGPMKNVSGFDATYGAHLSGSALCATCHTLFTPFVHQDGSVGGAFPEQTPFLEWKNSVYPGEGVACQGCHMPEIDDQVVLTTVPSGAAARTPFSRHEFVGGNRMMSEVLKAESEALGATADPVHFDSTIARARKQLASAASIAVLWSQDVSLDTLVVDIEVQNLAGHKLPTGFPSRGMWLEVLVTDGFGEVRFHSGAFDPSTGEIDELDEDIEPHYDTIRSDDQVQVYQSVMVDDFGVPTTTLLRGAAYGKDNRIPPRGYRMDGPDTGITAPLGLGDDDDFNRDEGSEGSGSDHVRYRIGGLEGGVYTVNVRLLYTPLMPSFVKDLLESEEGQEFAGMLDGADRAPDVLGTATFDAIMMSVSSEPVPGLPADRAALRAFPNPADGPVTILTGVDTAMQIEIYDVEGRLVRRLRGARTLTWDLLDSAGRRVSTGTYFLRAEGHPGIPGSRLVVTR